MTENNFSSNGFHHSIYLNSPVDKVYKAIASAMGLQSWFIGNAVFTGVNGNVIPMENHARKDDTFKWNWLAKDLSISGKVLVAIKNEEFSFTFGSSFKVTITLKAINKRTLLTLTQKYSPGAERNDFANINCCVCWGFFLTNLKSVLEHGNDLRETLVDDESLINR
jgi:uncharacterized protein YndB with AHSA1/START domain